MSAAAGWASSLGEIVASRLTSRICVSTSGPRLIEIRLQEIKRIPQISAFFYSHCHVNVHHYVLESCVHFLKTIFDFLQAKKVSAMSAKTIPGHLI